jgi:hypothetical protein
MTHLPKTLAPGAVGAVLAAVAMAAGPVAAPAAGPAAARADAAGAGAAASAARQERVLATEVRPTAVAAWRGTVVWSAFDPAAGVYRLVRSVAGGPPEPLPVAAAERPFDVDLGTSRTGALIAVYSRCEDDDTGCDLYRLRLATGEERRLDHLSSPRWDERSPSVFRGRVAFVRRERAGGRLQDTIRIGELTHRGRATRVVVRGGGHPLAEPELGVSHLAYLRPRPGDERVHVVHLRTGRDRLVHRARSGGANIAHVTAPTLTDSTRSFVWARTNLGAGAGNRIVQYRIASGRLAFAPGSSRWGSTAWAGGDLGLAAAGEIEGTCFPDADASPAASVCRVTVTGPVRFRARP